MIFKFLLVTAFMTSMSLTVQAQEHDCKNQDGLTQQDMNICAQKAWQEADTELNDVWPKLRAHFKEMDKANKELVGKKTNSEKSLLTSQRAWINYRDGHCETEGAAFTGGSMQPLIINGCLEKLTRKRINELLHLMDER